MVTCCSDKHQLQQWKCAKKKNVSEQRQTVDTFLYIKTATLNALKSHEIINLCLDEEEARWIFPEDDAYQ